MLHSAEGLVSRAVASKHVNGIPNSTQGKSACFPGKRAHLDIGVCSDWRSRHSRDDCLLQ